MLYCVSQIYSVGSLIPTTQAQIVLVSRVSMTDTELTHTHPRRWEEWTIYSIFLRGKTAKICLHFLLMTELAHVMMISLPGGWSLITLFHTGVRRDLTPMCDTTLQPWICVPLPGLHHAGNKQPSDVLPSKETRINNRGVLQVKKRVLYWTSATLAMEYEESGEQTSAKEVKQSNLCTFQCFSVYLMNRTSFWDGAGCKYNKRCQFVSWLTTAMWIVHRNWSQYSSWGTQNHLSPSLVLFFTPPSHFWG